MNFFARKNERSRFTVAVALMIVMALDIILPITTAKSQSGPQGPTVIPGQTATRLPDGRWLLAGGEGAGGSLGTAAIWNPLTGNTTPLATNLQQARAWHSATILPEGQVLILGGLGSDGRAIQSAELFNPDTQTFSSLAIDGLSPRARHTATLLTDGHVLLSSGVGANGQTLATADLWSSSDGTVTALASLSSARRGHTATLLADGRVLLWGGTDSSGQGQSTGEIFDSATSRFAPVTTFPAALFPSSTDAPSLAASIPPDRMVNVPSDALIAMRFSKLLRLDTIGSDTLTLSGPNGIEKIKVVIAEDGRLIFVTPESLLLSGATYTVTINGARDRDGLPLPVSGFSFSTPQAPGGAGGPAASTPAGLQVLSPQPAKPTPQPQADADDDWVWKGAKKNGKPHSPWQDLGPLKAERGETALAGQVLDLKGDPLPNVTLKMAGEYGSESVSVQTDETGRFLLTEIKSGEGSMLIDGRSANRPGRTYGIFEVYVKIKDWQTNVLPYTIWMPRIDTAHSVKIDSPTKSEVVITTPKIPNLEVRIPAGAVIRDHEYKVVTEIGITPMPVDRPPFALPPRDVHPPAFFTVQPGVSKIYSYSGGARLIYPNYADNPKPPKSRFDSWHYDAQHRGWYVYGQGTVSADGKQVFPDPGVSIYKFTGAMIGDQPAPPVDWPPPPENEPPGPGGQDIEIDDPGPEDGEPVDLATGLFVVRKSDLIVDDVIPIVLRRIYRTNDTVSRPFGVGSTHYYDSYLYSVNDYQDADLILPTGTRIHYIRISPGTGFADAVYEHTTTPSIYYKSKLAWNGQGWTLTLKNGTTFAFPESCPGCPSGGLNAIKDGNGNMVTISRTGSNEFNDPVGNITQITSPNGRWIKFTCDSSNRIIQAKDNINRTVNYEYDPSGRLTKVTDSNGGMTEHTYDSAHRMLTSKDARGIVFLANQFDSNGRVALQTQPNGSTFQFAYSLATNGKVTETNVTNPLGFIRKATFNASGYRLTDFRAFGTPVAKGLTFQRESVSNFRSAVTDGLNRTKSFVYDVVGNVTNVTRLAGTPDAMTTTFAYEPVFNRLTSVTNVLNQTTSFGYDTRGNMTSATSPLNSISFGRNGAGQLISVTNPLGNTWQLTRDQGDLVSITDPLGNTSDRFVDGIGQVIAGTNAMGNSSRFSYNGLGRRTSVTDSLNGVTEFGYDPNGTLVSLEDANNNITTYTYNNMDWVESRTDPLQRTESYQYDAAGNVTQFTDRKNQTTTYSYDALNRLSSITYGDSSTKTFTYDAGSRLIQVNDSLAGVITRTYDNFNRLTQETTPQGSVSYTYDALGRRATMTVPGQATINYSYDDVNRLTQIVQGSSVVSITYDTAGRRTSSTLPNGILVEYAYDDASRITGITYKKGATLLGDIAYEYDKAGNRTKTSGSFARTGIPQPVSSSSYNATNQQTALGDKTLTYDLNGNLTSVTDTSGTTNYTWNARNQLVGISGPGVSATFVYDGFGRREKKTINGNLTEFLYDGMNPVQETSGATVLANILTGPRPDEYFTRSDVSAGVTSNFLTDALGNTIALTDSAGAVQTEYGYDPFGGVTSGGATSSNSYQYTGRENDGTGLLYYRARYYHPALQRFISEDPLGFVAGPNFYAYVGNSPNNFTDPSGLFSPFVHFYITYTAYRETGHGLIESLQRGLGSMGQDFRPGATRGINANEHGMAQPGQTPEEAQKAIEEYIKNQIESGTTEGRDNANHSIPDKYPASHGSDKEWNDLKWSDIFNPDFWKHVYDDWFPDGELVRRAIDDIKRSLGGRYN